MKKALLQTCRVKAIVGITPLQRTFLVILSVNVSELEKNHLGRS
jgi:hypothetical protein